MSLQPDSIPTGSIWSFRTPLEFPAEDKANHPWLRDDIRYYRVIGPLDKGGFSIPYEAIPCSSDGKTTAGPRVVLKFPNIQSDGAYTSKEQNAREYYSEEKAVMEWKHIRLRLLNCKHANPILDFDIQWMGMKRATVTCQLFLEYGKPLEQWMLTKGYCQKGNWKYWYGLQGWPQWLEVTSLLGEALGSLHRHRVIHGDIWPPNIFVCADDESHVHVKFIDFGESSVFEPTGTMEQRNHPYRAPERSRRGIYVPTESVDVYSFGKMMLYLASGYSEILPDCSKRNRDQRRLIRDILLQRNPVLLKEYPVVLDLISRCTFYEPVNRPSMAAVLEDLAPLIRPASSKGRESQLSIEERLGVIERRYSELFTKTRDSMRHLVDIKLREVETILESFESEMVTVDGHRNQIIRGITSLFSELMHGDSWSTVTTPDVWQSSALGLDGRYQSANIEAIRRGVCIHRGIIMSVQELGEAWCMQFAQLLTLQEENTARRLAEAIQDAVASYKGIVAQPRYRKIEKPEVQKHNCQLLVNMLEALRDMISIWRLEDYLWKGDFTEIEAVKGFFVGLVPVATVSDVCAIRRDNPASLVRRRDAVPKDEQWLLVMTDVRGRNDSLERVSQPQLLGLRVYRSVMHERIPRDRIILLERLLEKRSIPILETIEIVSACAQQAMEECFEAVPSNKKS